MQKLSGMPSGCELAYGIWHGGMTLLVERKVPWVDLHRAAGHCAFGFEYQQTYDVVTIFEAYLS